MEKITGILEKIEKFESSGGHSYISVDLVSMIELGSRDQIGSRDQTIGKCSGHLCKFNFKQGEHTITPTQCGCGCGSLQTIGSSPEGFGNGREMAPRAE